MDTTKSRKKLRAPMFSEFIAVGIKNRLTAILGTRVPKKGGCPNGTELLASRTKPSQAYKCLEILWTPWDWLQATPPAASDRLQSHPRQQSVGLGTGTGLGLEVVTRTRTRRARARTRGSTGCPRVVRIDRITPAAACREASTPWKHEIC